MEFKKKENKMKITGRAAAVEETKTSAERLRQTLVTVDHEVCRPGKCFALFNIVFGAFLSLCCSASLSCLFFLYLLQ